MPKIIIIRDGESSEPYSLEQITELLKTNQVKLNDWAQIEGEETKSSLAKVIKKCGWTIPPGCGICKGLAHIGWDFVLPWAELQSLNWARD